MTSRFQLLCDAVANDQRNNVEGLENATLHLYDAADPQEGQADNKRHLSVFPASLQGLTVQPLAMNVHELVFQLVVMVWEDAGSTSSRGVSDTEATAAFWDLFERSLARFYVETAQYLDGTEIPSLEQVWFGGLTWPERSGRVRQFSAVLNVRFSQPFTAV